MEETGMSAVVTSLTTGLSAANLWAEVANVAPLIIIVTLFALGVRVLNKNLKAAKNEKQGKA